MLTLKDIAAIKDPEEKEKALEAYKQQRANEAQNDPMREVKQKLQARIMGCPQFLTFAIAPIPNFLQGKVPADALYERVLHALQIIDFCKPEIHAVLEESYSQEVALIRAMIHAFGAEDGDFALKDLSDETELTVLQQEVKSAFEAYMDQPEMQRKNWIL